MKDFRPEEKTYIIPMPKEDFIRHIERIIQNHKKEKWEFLFPPYLDISNVTLKKDTLIVYKSSRSKQTTSNISFSGTIEASIIENGSETLLKPKYFLDTSFAQFGFYLFIIAIILVGGTYLIFNPSIIALLVIALIAGLLYVIRSIVAFENENNLKLYFSRILRELMR